MDCPAHLADNREKWAVYARNEVLSIATQGLFYALLDAYEESGTRFDASAQVVGLVSGSTGSKARPGHPGPTAHVFPVSCRLQRLVAGARPVEQPNHEIALMEEIAQLSRGQKSTETRRAIIVTALRALIALASRSGPSSSPYRGLVFDKGYFLYYPINLQSFFFTRAARGRR